MKSLIVGVVLVLGITSAEAQNVECLDLYEHVMGDSIAKLNPDSVKLDTCSGDVWHYLNEPISLFAKRPFRLTFNYFILTDSISPQGDTIGRDWRDIPVKYSDLRDSFASVERRFGRMQLQHIPAISQDTGSHYSKAWYVGFENYVNVDSAEHALRTLPELDINEPFGFEGGPFFLANTPIESDRNRIAIWPVPASNVAYLKAPGQNDEVVIYDAIGRKRQISSDWVDNTTRCLNLKTLENGAYYVLLSGRFQPLVVQR